MNNKSAAIIVISLVIMLFCCCLASCSAYVLYLTYRVQPEPVPPPFPTPLISGTPIARDGCVVGGCSSTLCLDPDAVGNTYDTCIWREEFICYKKAVCELQAGGQCGWTLTGDYYQCLVMVE